MAKFPTCEEMAKDVAEKALDEYLIDGKTLREWIKIIAEQEPKTNTLKQIREEIACAMDMEPAWKGQDNYVGGLEIALSIIDKTLSEVSE